MSELIDACLTHDKEEFMQLKAQSVAIALPEGSNQRLHAVLMRILDNKEYMAACVYLLGINETGVSQEDILLNLMLEESVTMAKIAGIAALTMVMLDL